MSLSRLGNAGGVSRSALLLSALVAACAAVSLARIARVPAPLCIEEIGRLRASLRYLGDMRKPPAERLAQFAYRRGEDAPPFIPLLTVPLYLMAGTDPKVAVSVNTFFLAIMLLASYGIAKRLYSNMAGIAAALLLAGYPAVMELSGMYLPQVPEAAMAALCFLVALETRVRPAFSRSVFLGALLGLGVLVSWDFVLFGCLPAAYIILSPRRGILSQAKPGGGAASLFFAAAAAAIIAGPWYLCHFRGLPARMPIIGDDGFKAWIPLCAAGWPPSPFNLAGGLLFVAGLILVLLRRRMEPALLIWIAVPAIALTAGGVSSAHRLAPVLPAIAVLSAGGLSLIENRRLRRAALGAAWAVGFIGILVTAVLPLVTETAQSRRTRTWPFDQVLADLRQHAELETAGGAAIGLLGEHKPAFCEETFRYCIERNGLGVAPVNPEEAQHLLVRIGGEEDRLRLDRWRQPWLRLAERARYALADGSEAILYRSMLSRRRLYEAYRMSHETGEERVEDTDASSGWARYTSRDAAAGVLADTPLHPLETGAYRACVKLKCARHRGAGPVAAIKVRDGAAVLSSRDVACAGTNREGYRDVEVAFRMKDRRPVAVTVLHRGEADLWVDTIEIRPDVPAGSFP